VFITRLLFTIVFSVSLIRCFPRLCNKLTNFPVSYFLPEDSWKYRHRSFRLPFLSAERNTGLLNCRLSRFYLWFLHFKNTQTARSSHKPALIFQNKESRLKSCFIIFLCLQAVSGPQKKRVLLTSVPNFRLLRCHGDNRCWQSSSA
jgi:hypothetical protein